MWNPPLLDEPSSARARARSAEARGLLAELVGAGAAHDLLHEEPQGGRADPPLRAATALEPRATGARGSRPTAPATRPQQRREIERRLVEGELLGVVATDALELGIDIGALDAAICVDFPGTVASLRQMWGRAGRRGRGLAVSSRARTRSTSSSAATPTSSSSAPVEAAILDHENPQILDGHVLAAAYEGPLTAGRRATIARAGGARSERRVAAASCERTAAGLRLARRATTPAARVSLRSGDTRRRS